MQKFSKDQIQKMFLSGLLMVGLIYCYFTFLIGPLGKSEVSNAAGIAALDEELGKAKSEVKRSKAMQEQAHAAEETLAQVNDMIPEGAPIAWFPPRIHAFFERHNLKGVVVRPGSVDSAPDPAMHNFRNADWTIDVPQTGATPLGIALAGLENEEKLLEITRLQITTLADSPEKQHVSMNVTTLLK